MRNITFWYPDLGRMNRALLAASRIQELALPVEQSVADGEWVLANFEVAEGNRVTAAAGRATTASGTAAVTFEPRDWERLIAFSASQQPAPQAERNLQSAEQPEQQTDGNEQDDAPKTLPMPISIPRISGLSLQARLLFVEDDADTRDMVSIMLESVGLEVETTKTAERAIELLGRRQFEIVVVDWNLPGMSGLELCRLVRREGRNANIPILFLTGNTSPQDMLEAFASGADDYVTKPFRAAELGARIFALLRRARMAASAPS